MTAAIVLSVDADQRLMTEGRGNIESRRIGATRSKHPMGGAHGGGDGMRKKILGCDSPEQVVH